MLPGVVTVRVGVCRPLSWFPLHCALGQLLSTLLQPLTLRRGVQAPGSDHLHARPRDVLAPAAQKLRDRAGKLLVPGRASLSELPVIPVAKGHLLASQGHAAVVCERPAPHVARQVLRDAAARGIPLGHAAVPLLACHFNQHAAHPLVSQGGGQEEWTPAPHRLNRAQHLPAESPGARPATRPPGTTLRRSPSRARAEAT